ncbi:hypothetical protein Nepgr_003785 [Nepenthes gracilis]|uniref:Integrase zinc-binding domain-containing protein n=1 Tax=Nepenthes gracilis TaxID=150966 RepID=A0AAD3S057_NEPGR|nr:hypothetical protein Nepgr_003785 [Nepenthes gracilis]
MQIDTGGNWMTPYIRFLSEGTLPEDANDAKRVKKTAGWYTILNGRLYRRGYSAPLLKCLTPEEADYALAEVHLGLCGSHIGGKNLAFNVMRQGFYWPTMKRDAMEFVRKCESCQVHGNMTHQPHTELHYLQSPWPLRMGGTYYWSTPNGGWMEKIYDRRYRLFYEMGGSCPTR